MIAARANHLQTGFFILQKFRIRICTWKNTESGSVIVKMLKLDPTFEKFRIWIRTWKNADPDPYFEKCRSRIGI